MAGIGLFAELLSTNDVLVADGGMGTLLFERGLEVGGCPELLNVERLDIVAGIHAEYVAAGADIILTNTFGGTAARLGHFGLESRVAELNGAGVDIARGVAAETDRPVAVAGSMGPTGELFAPYGPLDGARARQLFAEQATALAEAGADVLWIETMSSIDEVDAAHAAAMTVGIPVVATMSFDTHGKTMMGVSAADLGSWAKTQERSPDAIGANCGIGPDDVVDAAKALARAASDIPVVAKANCGLPVFVNGELEYPLRPHEMPPYAEAAIEAGARIIGTCCGSVPGHIAAIRAAVDSRPV
jgi:5-methyltetrahydrofolate--homocysteine methyltransferase